jgi:hypothetical protein
MVHIVCPSHAILHQLWITRGRPQQSNNKVESSHKNSKQAIAMFLHIPQFANCAPVDEPTHTVGEMRVINDRSTRVSNTFFIFTLTPISAVFRFFKNGIKFLTIWDSNQSILDANPWSIRVLLKLKKDKMKRTFSLCHSGSLLLITSFFR